MPFKVDATLISWVDSDQALARAAQGWHGVIGLDTEFQRTDTFFPLPGLYQICAGERVYLIDPLAINEWRPLQDVLTDPAVVKVMHACSEDLELFDCHLGVAPANLFDTQLAHAFVSEEFSLGYARLIEQTTGELLDKGATRSNWLRRPLTDEQIQYAAADVWHLAHVHGQQLQKLHSLERVDWFVEDMRTVGVYAPTPALDYYRGVKGAGRLPETALQRLRELCAWREGKARAMDVPRNRVLRDEQLLELAATDDLDPAGLGRLLPKGALKRFGDDLVRAHGEAKRSEPVPPLPEALTPAQGKWVRRLREAGRDRAQRLGLAPELVSRRKDVEDLVRQFLRDNSLTATFSGWRADVVGDEYMNLLREVHNPGNRASA